MRVLFTARFIRMVGDLPEDLREEVYEKVELFRNAKNHPALKVHKLQGNLKGLSSFSVDYKNRIVFEITKDGYLLHAVGDHNVYK